MDKYTKPDVDVVTSQEDIVTASGEGTETPKIDSDGGIWDLDVG
jgi:hypothetical protein